MTTAFFSGTFFVEYHFPALVSTGGGRKGRGRGGRKRLFPPPHEVVRVASRKIKDKGTHIHLNLRYILYNMCT